MPSRLSNGITTSERAAVAAVVVVVKTVLVSSVMIFERLSGVFWYSADGHDAGSRARCDAGMLSLLASNLGSQLELRHEHDVRVRLEGVQH